MQYAYTSLFSRSYGSLSAAEKKKIHAAINKFSKQPHHPFAKGLRVHKLPGVTGTATDGGPAPDVWETHASRGLLITFQYGNDEVVFRNCGHHDAALQNP